MRERERVSEKESIFMMKEANFLKRHSSMKSVQFCYIDSFKCVWPLTWFDKFFDTFPYSLSLCLSLCLLSERE